MRKVMSVSVSGSDVGELLHHSMAISGRNKNYPLGAIAVLLTCAEVVILLAHEQWCSCEEESAIIELMRKKAKSSAGDIFIGFKKSDGIQELKSDVLGGSGNE
jgi:hypothetical protein